LAVSAVFRKQQIRGLNRVFMPPSSVNGTIPIRVASATENHSIQFHQYHLEDMGSPGVQPVAVVGRSVLMQLSADVPEPIHRYRCGAIARSGD
jgi:hypothetical protein